MNNYLVVYRTEYGRVKNEIVSWNKISAENIEHFESTIDPCYYDICVINIIKLDD